MQSLIAAINASIDPAALMRRIAEQMCLLTPKADGAAVSLLTADDTFVVVSSYGVVESLLGLTLPRDGTFQGRAIATGRPQVSLDVAADASLVTEVRDIGNSLGIQSLVVIPLLHGGKAIGALSMSATEKHKFSDRDVAAMQASGRFISALISSHTEMSFLLDQFLNDPHVPHTDSAARFIASVLLPDMARNDEFHERLDTLLADPSNLSIVFQPIVDLATGMIAGYEALCRFPDEYGFSPRQWFDLARRIGRSKALEQAALHCALGAAEALPGDRFTAVNLSPLTAMDPSIQDALLTATRPLVLEITEHEPFPDSLAEAVKPLRDGGIRLAIDDAGAGFASFNQLLRVRPDIIKIDGTLTAGIEGDPVKRALASSIVQLSTELSSETVAEAVEYPEQKRVLRQLGVQFGQGYLLGRPAALGGTRN